jgi:pyrrolysine biosynthesis protein PylD
VSISSGEGALGGFAASTAAVGRRLGLEAAVMKSPDEDGFAEAAGWGADYLIYADDEHYLAEKRSTGEIADNNPATSRAFVAALELMSGSSLKNSEVLVLGLGVIGRGAARCLLEKGARPYLYDVNALRRAAALAELGGGEPVEGPEGLARVLGRVNLIFDATNVRLALDKVLWPDGLIVAAPGLPLSWPVEWLDGRSPQKLWHDPLQSGTAAMLAALAD